MYESIAGGQTHRRAQVPPAPIRQVTAPGPGPVKPTLRLPTSDLALSKYTPVTTGPTGRASAKATGSVKTNWRRQPGGPSINIRANRPSIVRFDDSGDEADERADDSSRICAFLGLSTVRIDDSGDEAEEEDVEDDDKIRFFVATSGVPPVDEYWGSVDEGGSLNNLNQAPALRDGRKLIGVLRSWDQFANLVLQDTVERVFVQRYYANRPTQ
ncbi:hypothetical protein EJ08DRAFT_736734 [Tothia fuscella]|uniref:Sm domain-containing protein n=1 Tax=Tothia fuscella TaxID=1048955 RepID=A0A9P4NKQ7_9PEZI|nr:hypothetical protein EJ08DRAFT_736734 [Tothia fuscella]